MDEANLDMDNLSADVKGLKDKLEWCYNYLRLEKDSKMRDSVEFFKFFKDFFDVVDKAIPKE